MHFPEPQAEDNRLDGSDRTGAVLARDYEERPGPAVDFAFAGIKHALEEVLHYPGHVAEVLRRAEDERVRGEHILGSRLGAALYDHSYVLLLARAAFHRFGHLRGLHAARVIDDEQ